MNPSAALAKRPHVAPSLDEIDNTGRRIEAWLLSDAVQLVDGAAAGGIAGWLDDRGRPVFAYGEITGYWLSWAACACREREAVADRVAAAVSFLGAAWQRGHPPTRHYLAAATVDWRNRALFSFDMAMILRGLANAAAIIDPHRCVAVAEALLPWLQRCRTREDLLATHLLLEGDVAVPRRWSTTPGPFQMKTAACLLALPNGWVSPELASAAERSLVKWQGRAGEHADLHPRFYALEGEALGGAVVEPTLAGTILPADGWLPANSSGSHAPVRSDVLAQALRLLLLRDGAALAVAGESPAGLLARALLDHVDEEGAVSFEADRGPRNVWCAIFAHQALSWLAACGSGASIDPLGLV